MPDRPITIGLQYVGKHSLNVRAQSRRLVTKFYPPCGIENILS